MQSKDKNIKSICTEIKINAVVPVPAKKIAELAGVSTEYVKRIRQGKTSGNGEKEKKVLLTESLVQTGIQTTFGQVADIVNQEEPIKSTEI